MIKSNLHTHTKFSDGSDIPGKYLEEALKQQFEVLGFSDHAPVPFENNFAIKAEALDEYITSIVRLKSTVGIKILAGLEMDYIPGMTKSADHYRKNYPLDYLIGSVHLVKNPENGKLWFIDGPKISTYDEGLAEVFGGDIRKAVSAYYLQIREMISGEKPEIVGHLDKVKMYNRDRYFREDESWYQALVEETLSVIKENGCIVEVNTRGMYKKRSASFFPGPAVLKRIHQMNIPVILASDAHKPHELSLFFDEATLILKEMGFRSLLTGISGESVSI